MAFLEAAGTTLAQGAINYGMQKMFAADEQANYEKNQRMAFEYSQAAQRNAPVNLVEGMKNAGLSPALAAGQSFNAAPMSSAPLQNKNAPQMDIASMFQAQKQLEMMDAEKANIEEQTREKKILNDRMANEDAEYNKLISNMVADWKSKAPDDPILQGVYTELEEHPEKFSKGTFDALKGSTDFAAFVRESAARVADADLKNLISNMQAKGGIYRDIAKLPVEELKLMIEDQKLKRGLAINAYAQAKTEGERLKTLQKQQKELEERAKNIEEDTRRLRYGKYGNMYEHGDYDEAIAEILGGAAEETAKATGREAAELGADIVRAKTGTPHGIFKSSGDVRTDNTSRSEVEYKNPPPNKHTRDVYKRTKSGNVRTHDEYYDGFPRQ